MDTSYEDALRDARRRHWRTNLTVTIILLTIWAIAGLGCGVLFAEPLNHHQLGGIPLGFWFAQQGSIIVFIVVILFYALFMNALDKRFHKQVTRLKEQHPQPSEPAGGEPVGGDL